MTKKVAVLIIELEKETVTADNSELAFFIRQEVNEGYGIPWMEKVEEVLITEKQ